MRQYPRNRVKLHTYKRECTICGDDYLRSEMKIDYKKRVVCPLCFDLRHPRENPRSVKPERPLKKD